jgi:hypothetical protein
MVTMRYIATNRPPNALSGVRLAYLTVLFSIQPSLIFIVKDQSLKEKPKSILAGKEN